MINKDEVLKDLNGYLRLEEEMMGKLSDFYQALGWKGVIKEQFHGKVIESLNILKKDTQRHTSMVNDMIKYAEESDKDEF